MDAVEQLQDLANRLNRAWLEGRFEDLGSFFHESAVVAAPGSSTRISGREACVESYREFATQARIHQFDLQQVEADIVAGIAVVCCPYAIDYEIGGSRWRGTGRDLLVLTEDGGSWQVVWRTMMPGTEQEVTREEML